MKNKEDWEQYGESKGAFNRRRAVAEKQMRGSETEPVLMWSGGQHSTALGILMVKSGMKFTCAVQRRWYDRNANIPAKLPHQEKEYQWYKKWFEKNGIPVIEFGDFRDAMDLYHPTGTGPSFQETTRYKNASKQPFKGSISITWRNCLLQRIEDSGIVRGWSNGQALWCGTVIDYKKTSLAHLKKGQLNTQKFLPFYNEKMTHDDVMKIYDKYDMPKPSPEVGYMCWFCPQCTKEEITMVKQYYPELYHLHRANLLNINKHFIDNRVFQSDAWMQEFTSYLQHDFKKLSPKYHRWLNGDAEYGECFEGEYNMKDIDERFNEPPE